MIQCSGMKKTLAGSLLILAMVACPTQKASSANSPGDDAGNPDRGSFLFAAYCASCHGDSGQGDGPMAPRLMRDFNVKPVNFSLPAWQTSRSNEALTNIIRHGGKAVHKTKFMPAWASTLDAQQTKDLIAFVRELGNPGPSGYTPAVTLAMQEKLELGRTVYSLHCVACHGPRGKGDGPRMQSSDGEKAPPNFSKAEYFRNKTDDELETWAQSGVYHSGLPIDTNQSSWWHGPMNPDEIRAILLYLRSLPN
jgi:mono/diheme cytochrome c family protein